MSPATACSLKDPLPVEQQHTKQLRKSLQLCEPAVLGFWSHSAPVGDEDVLLLTGAMILSRDAHSQVLNAQMVAKTVRTHAQSTSSVLTPTQ